MLRREAQLEMRERKGLCFRVQQTEVRSLATDDGRFRVVVTLFVLPGYSGHVIPAEFCRRAGHWQSQLVNHRVFFPTATLSPAIDTRRRRERVNPATPAHSRSACARLSRRATRFDRRRVC
jgi:hypothetical protein